MDDDQAFYVAVIMIGCVLIAGLCLGVSQSRTSVDDISANDYELSSDVMAGCVNCSNCVAQFNISDIDTVHKLEKLNGVAMYSYLIMQDYDDTKDTIDIKRKVVNKCFDNCTNDNGWILTRSG